MNHAKIILVGCISAFVAITTALLGVAGTIIGSVLSSVLYNVLSEALEKPVTEGKLNSKILKRKVSPKQTKKLFSTTFEYDIAYIFPLVVIAVIQLLLILSFLSEWGFLPNIFLNLYLTIQEIVNNNLYRIMGISLLVMSVYPIILRPNIIKKSHGLMIAIVGLIFVARGFVDLNNSLTDMYGIFFQHFDFEIELVAFILLVGFILRILVSASENQKQFMNASRNRNEPSYQRINHNPRYPQQGRNRYVNNRSNQRSRGINESVSNEIQFESNDLLDDNKR